MPKLQQIERKNGSVVNHVNVPKEIVEEADWKKGDELSFKTIGSGKVEIKKTGEGDNGDSR